MAKKYNQQRLIEAGVLFGMGYVCGKHNLEVSKKDRTKVAKEYAKKVMDTDPSLRD